jgi:type I restriction enzyme, S subunit
MSKDLLLSRYGTIGEVRIVPTGQPFQASYSIAILKKVSEKLNKFIAIGLTSKPLQDQIKIRTRGAAQPDLGLAHIKEFAFPIPPEQEQQEILIRIEAAMNSIDKIEREYKEMKGELNQLDRSILAKAFRGELVPQDPNDEPAAVLLDRIRAEREQTSTPKQRGKTTRKNSSKQLSIDLE